MSEKLPDHNYIEQNSSVNSKSAEELKRENVMLTEQIQTFFEENNKLKSSNYYLKRKNLELGENLFYKITSNVFSVKDNVKLKVIKFSFLFD